MTRLVEGFAGYQRDVVRTSGARVAILFAGTRVSSLLHELFESTLADYLKLAASCER